MTNLDIPFNIDLLILTDKQVANMRPVKSLDVYVGGKVGNFNPDGLYSNEIFGVVGTKARSTRYSYIDLKVPILHPTLCRLLFKMKNFYKEIMAGKAFARWDPELQDFVKSDLVDGRTGYEFFCEYFTRIKFEETDSLGREQTIALMDKYRDNAFLTRMLVLPAGLRDIEVDEFGRSVSDEVNDLYYKLIAISNTINPSAVKASIEGYNPQRISLQNTVNEIYEYFSKIIQGKKNLLMGKWAGRKIFNGTRNVITSMTTTSSQLGHPSNVGFNDTLIGLYQTVKGLLPVTIYQLKTGFLDSVFSAPGAPALLTDKETLESKRVMLTSESYNSWLSTEGLEKILTYFKEETIRHDPIVIEGNYLGLVYKGPDGTFALINGIDQLPEDRDPKDCSPITLAELLYCSIYHVANNYPLFVTRYPITGIGSIYPSKVYMKSTVLSEVRRQLDPLTWEPYSDLRTAYEFPLRDSPFYNSLSPHSSRLGRLGADKL